MAREQGAFGFDDVVDAICDKLERRHPHVFGDCAHRQRGGADRAWEEQKRRERAAKSRKACSTTCRWRCPR